MQASKILAIFLRTRCGTLRHVPTIRGFGTDQITQRVQCTLRTGPVAVRNDGIVQNVASFCRVLQDAAPQRTIRCERTLSPN